MATYKQSGVDVELGDKCSAIAYKYAKSTFPSRRHLKGKALLDDGGFTGAIDMGDYFMVQNADGVGTKMMVAERMKKFGSLGADLVAMVADDAICVGAEVIAMTNVIDTNKLDSATVDSMMKGLAKVCIKEKILIPGGEIAELSEMVNVYSWNATAVGIVEKKKMITGKGIKNGDVIIGLLSPNFRSNGFSLVRHILKKSYGDSWHNVKFHGKKWGDIVLAPSIVYHGALLELLGRFGKKRKVNIKGIAHITGGGLTGNFPRILPKENMDFALDNLPPPPPAMKELQRLGDVSDEEAYATWNMGVGMTLVVAKRDVKKTLELVKKQGLKAQVIGRIGK